MPTGYTAAIKDGVTFEAFAMGCARAMGACISMRDEPSNAEIPEVFEPSGYNGEALKDTQAELEVISSLTPQEAEGKARAEYDKEVARRQESRRKDEALQVKYEAMLADVEAWEPPTTDHIGLKEFMRDQITESIRFDCDVLHSQDPVLLSGQDWVDKERERTMDRVSYNAKEHAAEVERAKGRTAWVKALRESLQ